MKKYITSVILAAALLLLQGTAFGAEFVQWENPRAVPVADAPNGPWTQEGNPYFTYYAPWFKTMHLMTGSEAQNLKEAGLVGGEACQVVLHLEISPVNSRTMYFITDTAGIYKTENGGKHWYNTTNNMAGNHSKGLCCDILDEKIVYANMRRVGVQRSRNGGKTWEQILPDTDSYVDIPRSDTIVQDASGNTYMAVGSGIYKLDRSDNLTNLTAAQFPDMPSLSGDSGVIWMDLDVTPDGNTIYALCKARSESDTHSAGIYVSRDGGKTWTVHSAGAGNAQVYDAETLAMHPENPQTIYVGMRITENSQTSDYGLYVSYDGGESFTFLSNLLNISGQTKKRFWGLCFGPKNEDGVYPMYYAGFALTRPLRVSYDYGKTFSVIYETTGAGTIRAGSTGYMYQGFAPDMDVPGRVVFGASGIYEHIYDESGSSVINRISSGFSGASVTDIDFDSKNRMFLCTMDIGAYMTDGDTGYSETTVPTFKESGAARYTATAVIDPSDDNHIISFVGFSNGNDTYSGIAQSSDGGKTFGEISADTKMWSAAPTEDITGNAVQKVASYGNPRVLEYSTEDENTIYSSYYNSYDNGKTWVENDYYLLDIYPGNQLIQIGINTTDVYTRFYLTRDGGESWEHIKTLTYANLMGVTFDPGNSNYVWIARRYNFCRLDISEKRIDDFTDKFDYKAFRCIAINPNNPDHMLLSSYSGLNWWDMKKDFKLAESLDGGETWNTVPGFWGSSVHAIKFSPVTNEAFISTMGGVVVYDYDEYNYHWRVNIRHKDGTQKAVYTRVNEDGVPTNNGGYIIAPKKYSYMPPKLKFGGWKYGGESYQPGELIPIE